MSGSTRGGGFSVVISATDNASKQIAAINKRFAEMQAPTQRLGREFNKLSSNIGLRDVSTAVKDLAGNFEKIATLAGRTAAPFAALAGAGGVAGIVSLARSWANFGSNLYLSSRQAGTSVSTLQGLGNAAQIAGGSADAATSSFVDLNRNMQLAQAGHGDQNFLAGMGSLGIDWQHQTSSQAMDQVLHKLAAMHNVQQQLYYGNAILGGSFTQLWPVISQGTQALDNYLKQGQQVGTLSEQQAQQAMQLRQDFERLGLSVIGLGNQIVSDLAPGLTSATGGMAGWLDANQKWLALDITKRIQDITGDVQAGISAVGGWQNALELIAGYVATTWAAKMIGSLMPIIRLLALIPGSGAAAALASETAAVVAVPAAGALGAAWLTAKGKGQTTAEQAATAAQGMQYFMGQGLTASQAAAIMGNGMRESSFNPNLDSIDPRTGLHHRGLFQDDPTRWAALTAWAHTNTPSALQQEQYAWHELQTSKSSTLAALKNAPNAGAGAMAFNSGFEVSGDDLGGVSQRAAFATQILNAWNRGSLSKSAELNQPSGASSTHTVNGNAQVHIKLSGAPSGTQVSSTSSGDLFSAPPRVEMPMPAGGGP
jgi:hypothetical protein